MTDQFAGWDTPEALSRAAHLPITAEGGGMHLSIMAMCEEYNRMKMALREAEAWIQAKCTISGCWKSRHETAQIELAELRNRYEDDKCPERDFNGECVALNEAIGAKEDAVTLSEEEAAAVLDYLENHATYREPIPAKLQAATESLAEKLKKQQRKEVK